jgi:hypothetical protein
MLIASPDFTSSKRFDTICDPFDEISNPSPITAISAVMEPTIPESPRMHHRRTDTRRDFAAIVFAIFDITVSKIAPASWRQV